MQKAYEEDFEKMKTMVQKYDELCKENNVSKTECTLCHILRSFGMNKDLF